MTTTAPATKPKASRAEVNRTNARMSTGPRSTAGKQRSKYNALKHGMTARTLVLPGEDPQKLQLRLETWTDQLQPQNDVEQCLLEQAVHATWKLDRAERAELARLAHNIDSLPRAQADRQQDVAAALGCWLLSDHDVMGNLRLRSDLLDVLVPDQKRTYPDCRHVDILDHPESIVRRLESTAAGCRWLLDRWAELGADLDKGVPWELAQKARAPRLLGKRPLDLDARQWAGYLVHRQDGSAAMSDKDADRRLDAQLDERLAGQTSATPAILRETVDRAMARLKGLVAEHRRRDEAEAARQADILAFDASNDGERLRRYQTSCSRTLFRSLDTFLKIRKSGVAVLEGDEDVTAEPAPSPSAADGDLRNEARVPTVDERSLPDQPTEVRAEPAAESPSQTALAVGGRVKPIAPKAPQSGGFLPPSEMGLGPDGTGTERIGPADAGTPASDPAGSPLESRLQRTSSF